MEVKGDIDNCRGYVMHWAAHKVPRSLFLFLSEFSPLPDPHTQPAIFYLTSNFPNFFFSCLLIQTHPMY